MGPVGPLMWQIGYPYREKPLTLWGAAQPPQLQSPAKTTIGEASDIGGKVPLEPFPKFRKCAQT